MSRKASVVLQLRAKNETYAAFDQLDGRHPWLNAVPEGAVTYKVRCLRKGQVSYFNYDLAKEMGLIELNHPAKMTKSLEYKLLDTFSLQIINEYDEAQGLKYAPETIKPNRYMATRYLQMQHPNKQGKTSGDGRCIWNGIVKHQGKTWDVSSRGTGVTSLAPGSVQARKPLRTGNNEFGYGCGLAEMDELLASAIQAEVMHLQGIKTERMLCIIDLGQGFGIGVRAGTTLFRPAHLFMYLKQNRHRELKSALDFLIDRQVQNKEWTNSWGSDSSKKYAKVLEYFAQDFAKFAATLDVEYIFAWLDWDGDNVLANAGIIDYGSVRQFGLRHDQYRYDDTDRFSTTLTEQKDKARLTVQVFAQLMNFIRTKRKKPLHDFVNDDCLKKFDTHFETHRRDRFLYKMGFSPVQRRKIQSWHLDSFLQFEKCFQYFEKVKANGGIKKTADGINQPAIFNMHNVLRELPVLLNYTPDPLRNLLPDEEIFELLVAQNLKSKDLVLRNRYRPYLLALQKSYLQLVQHVTIGQRTHETLSEISKRTAITCRPDRMTGNALIQIVDEIITASKKQSFKSERIQKIVDRLILHQGPLPEVEPVSRHNRVSLLSFKKAELEIRLYELLIENREDI